MKKLLNYKTTEYKSKEFNALEKLFYWASGADIQILERCSYSDNVKQFCLGGIILATGVLAGLAGGYAFYTIFSEPKTMVELNEELDTSMLILSSLFGIVWGYIILNLDRYIVSSTGKGDGTDKITWREFKNAIPRLILGSIIALTISNPLEIRMLQSEINAELRLRQDSYLADLREQVDNRYMDILGRLEIERSRIDSLRSGSQGKADELQDRYIAEMERPGNRGEGPIAKRIKAEKIAAEKRTKEYQSKVLSIEERIKKKESAREQERESKVDQAKALDGLAERIRIAHEKYPDISLFITLLFLALELTPIFFKLMIIRSPYDYLEQNVHRIIKAREAIEFRPEYYKVGEDADGVQIDYTKYYVPDQLIQEQFSIIEKQKTLTEHIIKKWSEEEAKKIDDNIDDYIEKPK